MNPTMNPTRAYLSAVRGSTAAALAALCAFAIAMPVASAEPVPTAATIPQAAVPQLKPTTAETATKPLAKTPPTSPDAKRKAAAPAKPEPQTASRGTTAASPSGQSIVALVNDEPVTAYEIQQRAIMLGGSNINAQAQQNFQAMIKSPKTTERLKAILAETIKANEGKSKDEIIAIFEKRKREFALGMQKQAVDSARSSALPGVKKAALEELIDEKLKLQEAKRTSVVIGDDEVGRSITNIAERNKITEAQLSAQLGGTLDLMKNRIRSSLSWNEVIRRQFGAQIAITSKDVDKFVASSTASGEEQVELQLQRIRLAMPVKLDQTGVAQRLQEAENIRAKFKDCKTAGSIAAGVPGAKFEDLGKRRPSAFTEPTRTLLLNAKDGEMLPPSVGEGGIELYAVCGRDVLKAEDQKRTLAEGELKQKEFELLSKRRLKDLRQDAHIEYR